MIKTGQENNCQKKQNAHWGKQELKNLSILVHMGATTDEITTLVQRSPQSIEKKIDRLQLKPKSTTTHRVSIKRHIPKELSVHDLETLVRRISDKIHSEKQSTIILELQKLFPFEKTTRELSKSQEKKREESNETQWKSLTEVAQFLNQNNRQVRTLTDYSNQLHGFTHIVDNKRHSPSTLLREANIIRQKAQKELFYIEETTEE